MSSIQDYLRQILQAVYGKDVRKAIHDAINQCYIDASAGITPVITTELVTGGTQVNITVGDSVTSFVVQNGEATDTQVETYISEWLDNHPEATTTVQDGSITVAKLASGVIDSTLSEQGKIAESKTVGDALAGKADDTDVDALDDRVTAVEDDVSDLTEDLDYYRDEFGASIQYADATAFENGYRYNLSSSNVFSKVSADGYATLAITGLKAGTYYFNYTYDAFCIIEKISDGSYEKLQARTGYSNTAIAGGRNTTIDYDFNMYITRQTAWTSNTLWCNDALPSTYVHGIYGLPFLDYTMQTESVAVTSSNYASVLPDLDDAEKNRIYLMVFANGSTNIPANYPFPSWRGTTATLITYGSANSSAITQMLFLDGYIFTRRKASATTWNGWYTPTSKVFTVDINGGGDYTSLKDCCADAINYANATIYVNAGTYDLIEEFGADYFANLGSSDDRAGIQLGNGMHIIFSSQAKVTCHYTGDNTNVDRYFSPFNSKNGSFILENATVEASRVRYCVHDEHTTNTNRYTSVYKNCHMRIDNTSSAVWTNAQCIGGGLGTNGEIIIEDSYFYGEGSTQNQGVVSYHNCSSAGSKSRIVVKGCYFDGTDSTVRFGYYGASTEITECFVHGNSFSVAPLVRAENASASVVNMKMYAYSNEIRSA